MLFLLCLGFAFINKAPFFQDNAEIQKYDQNHKDHLDKRGTSESTQTKTITKEQIYQGNLLLINSEYPVQQKSIKSDVINLFSHKELTEGYGLLNNEIKLSEEIARKFSEMIAAAEEDGVSNFLISSGYRDFDEQNRLYEEMGSDYALPAGHSEHNIGLAIDVGSTQMKMEEAPEGEWIEENSWKYGFILRYPKDKTVVTGIQYEPWHIRYVGLPHSAIMKEKNFALEEYMDFLKEQKSTTTTIDHHVYKIFYYPITQNTTIPVPANGKYEISGNNMDGVIVTVYSGKRD
ncbi:VanY-A/VanY-F/VanY-M family D-Ala-D-Ala carboxypeptidase [Pseudalkalibacillus salsuginis]|uniref:VanY-A/VanY-F/VanY-M family D-Ala-D-Ala carboxypeptidase n=1 Tax=Pseudalkalibacillus salsuginis TaxID=2910972 RepID=UPI001F26005C|nr:VanY-A/VanY-F/VanY-M family D-Ala-D-Ala carboxypeptidase [Pseudalkalibacillus salsuginis]MCF6409627.1 VanY-A/VanY-F/VanY-M family D-Ala-D-Ala carboxypeptidase [Pseudalkalibacillus salsuginis]